LEPPNFATIEQPIKYALAGCGRIGRRHAMLMQQYGSLVAVCDILADRSQAFGADFNAASFTSFEEMLEQTRADVVAICTPNGLHAMQSIAALKSGFHVLCEKPMALNVADAMAMRRAAAEAGRTLMVVKQNRFNPPVQAVKGLLDQGLLGPISSVQINCFWNRQPDYYKDSWKGTLVLDGGTLYTQFSHFIDLLCWFFGSLTPVAAILANRQHQAIIEFEDTGLVLFHSANQIPGSLHYTVNAFGKNMEGSITIFGEKGTVKIGGEYLNELEYQQLADGAILNLPPGNPANQYGHYTGSMSNHHLVYEVLPGYLAGKNTVLSGIEEAVETVRFIEEVYRMAGR
jgi:predicted dehydrogenase